MLIPYHVGGDADQPAVSENIQRVVDSMQPEVRIVVFVSLIRVVNCAVNLSTETGGSTRIKSPPSLFFLSYRRIVSHSLFSSLHPLFLLPLFILSYRRVAFPSCGMGKTRLNLALSHWLTPPSVICLVTLG